MNKEEILNKYINLIDKGYCSDCNELNCIDNFPHSKITHAIRELQQENKKYKEVIDKVRKLIEKHYYKESDDYYDYFTEGVCLQDGDYNEIEDILNEVSE